MALSDGTKIAQQCEILNLVGKETGLYPTDIVASAKLNEWMDHMKDVYSRTIVTAGVGMEGEEKLSARKTSLDKGDILRYIA